MNKNLTEIILIIDKSGSMLNIKKDTEGGINALIADQRESEGEAHITLVEFSNKPNFVYEGAPVSAVKDYTLKPGGSTSLLDAIGETLIRVGQRLENTPEQYRPGLVSVNIITDGEENTSKEYDNITIANMISIQQDVYNWKFSYLGADQDSFSVARNLGMSLEGVCNYTKCGAATKNVFASTSAKLNRMRGASASSLTVDNSYTSDEIDSMTDNS